MKRILFVATTLAALVVGCLNQELFPKCDDPKRPCPPVEPDYLASAEGACVRLAELGCAESRVSSAGITCPMAFRKMESLVDPKYACVVRAKDVAGVRACGSVRCAQ